MFLPRWAIPPEGLNCEPGVDLPTRRKPWICRRFHNKASWKVSKILRASNHKSSLLLLGCCCCCCSSSSTSSFFKWYLLPPLYCVSQSFLIPLGGRWSNFICVFLTTLKGKSHESHEASWAQLGLVSARFCLEKKATATSSDVAKLRGKWRTSSAGWDAFFLVRVRSLQSMTNFFGPLAIMNWLNKSIATTMIFEHKHVLEFLNLGVEPVFFFEAKDFRGRLCLVSFFVWLKSCWNA